MVTAYSHIWVDSRSDTVYGPVSETVKFVSERCLKSPYFCLGKPVN